MKKSIILLIAFLGSYIKIESQVCTLEDLTNLIKKGDYKTVISAGKQLENLIFKKEGDTSLSYTLVNKQLAISYSFLGKIDSADYFFIKANDLFKYQNRENSFEYGNFLTSYAAHKKLIGDFKNSGILYEKSLNLLNKPPLSESLEFARFLNNYGYYCMEMGFLEKADSILDQSLSIYSKNFPFDKSRYVFLLHSIAMVKSNLGLFKEADVIFKEWFSLSDTMLNRVGSTVSGMNDYAENLIKQEQFKSAEIILDSAQQKLLHLSGDNKLKIEAKYYKTMGLLYYKLKNDSTSKKYYLQAEFYLSTDTNRFFKDLADVREGIADVYIRNEIYDSAEIYAFKALVSRKINLDEMHPDYASSLNQMSKIYKAKGQYDTALVMRLKALEIRKIMLSVNHPDYAGSLNNLGNLYLVLGDFKNAEKYYLEALAIRKKTYSENHSYYAASLHNLGDLYFAEGDFKSATSYYETSIEIKRKLVGAFNLDYANTVKSLARLYIEIGSYVQAEKLLKEVISIFENLQKVDHTTYATTLNLLGLIYYKTEFFDKAEIEYLKGLQIIENNQNLGKSSRLYAEGLYYLGRNYLKKGDLNLADTCFVTSFSIRSDLYRNNLIHPEIAKAYKNFGDLYTAKGDFELALSNYQKAYDINKLVYGENHRETVKRRIEMAHLFTVSGEFNKAYKIFDEVFQVKSFEISNNFEWLTDEQKEAFWKQENQFYFDLFEFGNRFHSSIPELGKLNYNAALIMKSKLLESKISAENYYRELDNLREKIALKRRLLIQMDADGYNINDSIVISNHTILTNEIDSLDKQLTKAWPEYGEQKKNLLITWDKVEKNLDFGEAAIEFIRFYNSQDKSYNYNALLLRKGDLAPLVIQLCSEKELKLVSNKFGFSAYYPLIWQPLEEPLKKIKTIYFSPMGELNNIPFHALYAQKEGGDEIVKEKTLRRGVVVPSNNVRTESNAEYLIDRFTLHQLTSTRYLAMGLKQKEQEPIGKSIALIGGVNYDFLNSSHNRNQKVKKYSSSKRSSESVSGKLAYLEGSNQESILIRDSVQSKQWKIELLSGNEASEENLIRMEGRHAKNILHIATHGYAFANFNFKDSTFNQNSLRYSYRYSTNPMVRSGLILAGGNWAWTGSDTLTKLGAEQNGILTALEVSQLNLKKTKLVVLSACETGLGKIEGSEGTFGLKRGFKLAGVEQMIVSLWSVPDKETMELMTLFYSDLTKSLNPVISFEKAQKEMRTKYPTDPEKWAGFVLVR